MEVQSLSLLPPTLFICNAGNCISPLKMNTSEPLPCPPPQQLWHCWLWLPPCGQDGSKQSIAYSMGARMMTSRNVMQRFLHCWWWMDWSVTLMAKTTMSCLCEQRELPFWCLPLVVQWECDHPCFAPQQSLYHRQAHWNCAKGARLLRQQAGEKCLKELLAQQEMLSSIFSNWKYHLLTAAAKKIILW